MKKIIVAMLFMAGTLGFTNAQAQQKTTAKKPVAATTVKAKDSVMAKKSLVKKNGTPDMRYKENKLAKATPVGPVKKNGTPDLRYKANKPKSK
jgi:hypothetical protein